ncbi:MAG: glycosyltransferase family 39 protein [Pseudoflavonifractor sp.]|nr:glycosyltransferase family 39 protein [Pseudoflavonifractor sp.]
MALRSPHLQIKESDKTCLWLLIICAITVLPWLGLTPFNTKGEPREAVVAMSMLQQHDWILPSSCGGDIPYKPPFLAWLVALLSLPLGHVTEYTSRLPSALALIAMTMAGFRLYSLRAGTSVAFIAAVVTMTSFEVNRAAMTCRVDMLMTAFMVMAMYCLYRHIEHGLRRGVPWVAVALMSCGVLTKGPVGMLLPCLVTGIYLLIRGHRFWPTFGRLAAAGLLSLIIPAVWYIAAYNAGGDEFARLAIEENFGRFTGSMSYESHSKPLYYNFITLVAGWLPYTLLLLMSLVTVRSRRGVEPIAGLWDRIRHLSPPSLYSLTAIVVIFIFYCIPDSKRSVYLLPIYPFIGYFIARLIKWLARSRPGIIKAFGCVMATMSLIVCVAFVTIRLVPVAPEWFTGRHATQNLAMADALHSVPVIAGWLLWVIAFWAAAAWWRVSRSSRPLWSVAATLAVIVTLYWSLAGLYQPIVLSTKSDRDAAREIAAIVPEGEIYTYIPTPMLRYYTINFYIGDRTHPVTDRLASGQEVTPAPLPDNGYILMNENDLPHINAIFPGHTFTEVYHNPRRSCDTHATTTLYRFSR